MAKFAMTVAQALPALALSTADQQSAQTLAGQIANEASEPRPDHRLLKALGGSLRAVLEGSAGNVLAAALLEFWHP